MAEITKELGRVPISRGEFNLATTYYKDNIVQYQYASYQVTAESITGVAPVSPEGVINTGWIIFGGSVETDKINKVLDHGVLTDNWDEQDDDPEDYDPLAVTEASFAYNWKSVTNPNKIGNIEDLVDKVDALAVGVFYGYTPNENELPQDITEKGYAYVGTDNPYKIYNFDGTQWKDSGTTIQATSEADEEDITYNENDKLTFKDRNNTDGMGYVILRKNKSFAEQVTKENTIYEIRYEFNLNGATNIVPTNCIFFSNGGSVNNGIIQYNTNCLSIPKGDCKIKLNFTTPCDTILPLSRLTSIMSATNIIVDSDCDITNSWNTEREQLYLDGYGHKLSLNTDTTINTKNLYAKDIIFENITDTPIALSFCNSAQSFFNELQRNIVFDNCTFIGIELAMFYDTKFRNCKFINCRTSVLFADGVSMEDPDNYINISFNECDFIAGDFNLNNNELLHIIWCGWKGAVEVDKCHFFVNFDNANMLDMIDTYDSCNVKITNSSFYTKSILRGEGIINVKSHSYSETSPLPQDIIGNKYSTIISNNSFVIDYINSDVSTIGQSFRGIIWVRNQPRNENDEIFQRRNVIISNNSVSIKSGGKLYSGDCNFAFVYSLSGIENLTITDNVIVSDIGYTEIFLMGSCMTNTYYNNILIKGNLLYGENNTNDNNKNTLVSIIYRDAEFSTNIELGKKVRNFLICNNCVYGDTSRDSSNNNQFNIFPQIQYVNNLIYNSRLNSRLSTVANIYNLDYNNKFKALPILGKNNRCIFQGEGNNIYDALGNNFNVDYSGNSNSRPSSSEIINGFAYFDTTLGKPIWWTGTKWVDATGADV